MSMIGADALIGTIIDNRYRLMRTIGKGSFGWVFEAREEMAGEYVGQAAVKLLAPEDEAQRDMVLREIRALAGLNHEYIIGYRTSGQITDGSLANTIFLVTELGEESLVKTLQRGERLSEAEVWTVARGIASALAYIHARGSMHRDVKPENILRVEGRWKLGDFGLVRAVEGTQMSSTGAKGTLRYMAPELLNNEVTAAADVYALGVTLLRCLTGSYAHQGDTEAEFMANLMSKRPRLPAELSETWRTILAGCLSREPRQRWSADCLAQQLESGPEVLSPTEASAGSPTAAIASAGYEHRPSPADVGRSEPPGDVEDKTTRLDVQIARGGNRHSGSQARPSAPVLVPETQPSLSGSGSSQGTASLFQPSVELRLAEPEEVSPPYAAGAVDAYFDNAVGAHRRDRRRSRLLRVVVVLGILAVGAGGYAWHLGKLDGIVQRVKFNALENLPRTSTSEVLELTVLADHPVHLRRAPQPDAASLGALTRGATVKTIGKTGEWYKVQMLTGGEAWIHQSAFLGGDADSTAPELQMQLPRPRGTQESAHRAVNGSGDSSRASLLEPPHNTASGSLAENQQTTPLRQDAVEELRQRRQARRAKLLRIKQTCTRQPDLPICQQLRRASR